MKKTLFAAALTGAVLTGGAQAATVNVTWQDAGNAFGADNFAESIRVESPGFDGKVKAGQFQLTGDNGFGNFAAFCVDIYQALTNDDDYETPVVLFGAAILDNIDRLFTSVYADVDSATEAAAFQVALWEIIYDNNGFDLDGGAFHTSENAAVEALAGTYLSGLSTAGTGGYGLTFLASQNGQDLVTASPVPLPASGVFLVAGLGGLAAMRRRRKG